MAEINSRSTIAQPNVFDQAKEMEKEKIVDASYYGHLKGWVDDSVENSYGEQYYNETYESKCVFEARTDTTSATICKWCGQEKFLHKY
jgi:hypothetical protein